MNGVQNTVSAFSSFLRSDSSALAAGTINNYTHIIRNVLEMADPDDLTNPQMLLYLKAAVSESYRTGFTGAWQLFSKFCDIERDIELPKVPEARKVHFVHPIEPDLRVLLTRYYNGIPADLDWQKFVTDEKDPKMISAAQRAYEFFTKERQPRADQPLIPRSSESNTPMPLWVLEAILGTRRRMTSGAAELFHRDINAQLSSSGMSVLISQLVYQLFVVSGESIRRKTSSSREDSFEFCEAVIRERDHLALLRHLRSYLGVKPEHESEMANVLFQ